MATTCQICGKTTSFGHNVSHSKRRTRRRWFPNVQPTRIVVNSAPRRVRACTRCIRTIRKLMVS